MLEESILRQRTTPGHPTFNRGVDYIYRFYKKENPKLTKRRVKEILSQQRSYTIHKPYKKPRKYNPTFVHGLRRLIQLDLFNINQWGKINLATRNKDTVFISTAVDCFSRFVVALPLQNKTAEHVLQAIKETERRFALSRPDKTIKRYFMDNGTEYSLCRKYFEKKGVKYSTSSTVRKASIVERFQLTLQRSIYEHMTHTNSYTYINDLQKIVDSYNNAKHSFFDYELSPAEAEKEENAEGVYLYHSKRYSESPKREPILNVGDLVRIKRRKGSRLDVRGYHEQYSLMVYEVVKVFTNLPIPSYIVRDLVSLKEFGRYYESELVKIDYKSAFQIQKVLRRRVVPETGTTQFLIRFHNFTKDIWLNEEDIEQENNVTV